MSWYQTVITLGAKKRGCHLVTKEILSNVPKIKDYKVGLANLFIQHTSASLSINENCDSDVRLDLEDALNYIAPESNKYRHDAEGSDDMPAHVKSTVVGVSINIPITNGALNLGTWQGIYMLEHRNHAHGRSIVVTLQGELFNKQ